MRIKITQKWNKDGSILAGGLADFEPCDAARNSQDRTRAIP